MAILEGRSFWGRIPERSEPFQGLSPKRLHKGGRDWAEFLKFIYFYLFFWLFVSVRGLSLVAASGGHSSSRCAGLSLSRPLLLRSTGSRRAGSVIVAHGPSCSVVCGIIPRPGLEPVSPALAGGFSTTAPPGKPPGLSFKVWISFQESVEQGRAKSVGSVSFTLTFASRCFCSLKGYCLYIMACLREPRLNVKPKFNLCSGKHPDLVPPVDGCKEEEMNTAPP